LAALLDGGRRPRRDRLRRRPADRRLGAAFAVFFLHSQDAVGATTTSPGLVTEGQAFAVEAILAAVFIAVILTVTRRQPSQAAFVIGLTLIVIHFAAIPFSGASVNPARSLAPAIVSGKLATTSVWIYLTAPFLGSIVGWAIYRFFGPSAEAEEEAEEEDDEEELYEDELDELDETPA
jgi:formate/nitrite transporter FocA (FNT family)